MDEQMIDASGTMVDLADYMIIAANFVVLFDVYFLFQFTI